MSTILLVEDNEKIREINCEALQMRGFMVFCAQNLKKAESYLTFHKIDLIILDVMLPDGNGIKFCEKLRQYSMTPVLFLSALGEKNDVISGLRAGGDDYLTKPYDLEELIARVEAGLRRNVSVSQYINYGPVRLDICSVRGYLNNEDMLLTKKEYAVLLLLTENSGQMLSKSEIYERVWGQPMWEDGNALWTVVSRLKKKLRTNETGITITLQRQEGYVLEHK